MRNLVFLIFISVNVFGQKTPKTIVDFNNFDIQYIEELLHEKFNTEISKILNKNHTFRKDSIAYKAIEYQLSHFKNGGEFDHTNTTSFRGVLLANSNARINYFMKKNKCNSNWEVCTHFYKNYHIRDTTKKTYYVKKFDELNNYRFVKTEKLNDNRQYYTYDSISNSYTYTNDSHLLYNDQITYETIVKEIHVNLMIESIAHRNCILFAAKNNFVCYWKVEFYSTKNYFRIWSGSVFFPN
jgi:hypothetical protein